MGDWYLDKSWAKTAIISIYSSVLDGFNLEQLVDDELIHMVFKSLSISRAINLQDTLHSFVLLRGLTALV